MKEVISSVKKFLRDTSLVCLVCLSIDRGLPRMDGLYSFQYNPYSAEIKTNRLKAIINHNAATTSSIRPSKVFLYDN